MDISGYVVLGIVTLFLVYLMPQLIRSRQEVLDSRLADRFSADLRILATAGVAGGGSRVPTADDDPHAPPDPRLLRTEVSAMDRPTARVTSAPTPPGSDDVRARTARRRRAAARRRLILTLALLGLSAWAWTSVVLGTGHVVLAAAATTLLSLVLVLGRRAAAAAARADRRAAVDRSGRGGSARPADARRAPEPAPERPRAQWGTPSRENAPGGEASTEIIPRLRPSQIAAALRGDEAAASTAGAAAGSDRAVRSGGVEAEGSAQPGAGARGSAPVEEDAETAHEGAAPQATAKAERAASGRPAPGTDPSGSWTPVPVPVPTYTLKPAAPRTTPAPLVLDEPAPAAAAEASAGRGGAAQAGAAAEAGGLEPGGIDEATSRAPAVDGTGGTVRRDDGSVPVDETAASQPAPSGPGLDLDAVLSRRRASGE